MGKIRGVSLLLIFFFMFHSCSSATVYSVGGNAGWDISTDLDSWANDKTFSVGDTLLFQYSQYHSVSEVTKENYEGCNTTNVLQSSSNGNTSIALTQPGDRFFVCGNKLHCLGGMKFRVHVIGAELTSPSQPPLPQTQSGPNFPTGSTKSNHPSNSSSLVLPPFQTLVLALFSSLILILLT